MNIDTSTDAVKALAGRLENVSMQTGYPSRTIMDSAVIRKTIDTITALIAERDATNKRADAAELHCIVLRISVLIFAALWSLGAFFYWLDFQGIL